VHGGAHEGSPIAMEHDDERRAPPHDRDADEPLGPATPDEETDLGDTPEAHDEISPHDVPKGHPGRQAAEDLAGDEGTTSGNV
jgi:hypothetical protein